MFKSGKWIANPIEGSGNYTLFDDVRIHLVPRETAPDSEQFRIFEYYETEHLQMCIRDSARGAGRCRDTGCADAPVQLFWLFSIHQRSGKEDESKNQGEAAGRITAITKHYSSRAQSTKIGCAFSRPAPYSEERRRAVSKAAKKCGVNDIGRSVHKNLL